MGTLIRLDDYRYPWREALAIKTTQTTLQVYVNDETGEVELAQMNDEGEALQTPLDAIEASMLLVTLQNLKRRTV